MYKSIYIYDVYTYTYIHIDMQDHTYGPGGVLHQREGSFQASQMRPGCMEQWSLRGGYKIRSVWQNPGGPDPSSPVTYILGSWVVENIGTIYIYI